MIGVLLREDNNKLTINKEIYNIIYKYNKICLSISSTSLEEFIPLAKICDGFILQGGVDYTQEELEMVKYLYDNNIPTLGICLGMQMMGCIKGKLKKVINHNSKEKYAHKVYIDKESKLYGILKKEIISVNSRHNECIKHTNLNISAISSDNIIEAIEDKNKRFFIGVQWHPESLNDSNSKLLFDNFFNNLK